MFAAIHEPFSGSPFIESIQQVYTDDWTVALEVRHGGYVDHIVHRTVWRKEPLVIGKLSLNGEFGFVRERDGAPTCMGLWGGDELRWEEEVIRGEGAYNLEVTGVLRKADGDPINGLQATGGFPGGVDAERATAIVSFGDGTTMGYRVKGIVRAGRELTVETADDPGFSIDSGGMRHLFFPLRAITGPVTCRIRTSAFVWLHG